MRTLLKISMDVEKASRAIQDGSMQRVMNSVLDEIHPEAAYFTAEHGRRTAFIFFDLADPSQIPAIAEPFFSTLGAEIELSPVMNRDDLKKGLQNFSVKKAA
ncbi:MAG: hypothetical protein A2X94_07655 [Bdellovibrionales bacterium GWB1_55_8]|nr:MAG: hypothetical protein A2X94_07655 [Bdellovibrionales bacterium GWB1_55_8]